MRCVECNREVELRIKLHCGCTADTEDQYIQASNPQRDSMGHDYAHKDNKAMKKKSKAPNAPKKWDNIRTCIFCGIQDHRTTKCELLVNFLSEIGQEVPSKNPKDPYACFYCGSHEHYLHSCSLLKDLMRSQGHEPHPW